MDHGIEFAPKRVRKEEARAGYNEVRENPTKEQRKRVDHGIEFAPKRKRAEEMADDGDFGQEPKKGNKSYLERLFA